MSNNLKPSFYPLDDEGVALMRDYVAELNAMTEDHEEIKAEFQAQNKASMDIHHVRLRELWRKLSAMVGLDPAMTWRNSEYGIEIRYIDRGFAAILFNPAPVNPLLAADQFSDEETETEKGVEDPALIGPPKGTLVN